MFHSRHVAEAAIFKKTTEWSLKAGILAERVFT